jgi:hypothetical protein
MNRSLLRYLLALCRCILLTLFSLTCIRMLYAPPRMLPGCCSCCHGDWHKGGIEEEEGGKLYTATLHSTVYS